MTPAPFVKVFAAPGIDSHISEQGVFNSGAGLDPEAPTLKTPPYDWGNEAPTQGLQTECLVGGFSATKAPIAKDLSIRKRGISPWGGRYKSASCNDPTGTQHPGGITDMNPGSSHLIAGGPGAASSLCRLNVIKNDRAMKLPILPQTITRGGVSAGPTGGGSHEPLTAPLKPKITGWPTIFKFVQKGAVSK